MELKCSACQDIIVMSDSDLHQYLTTSQPFQKIRCKKCNGDMDY